MKVTAVVVTKGGTLDVKVTQSLRSFDEVIVWDNSRAPKNVRVYGRFAGALLARNEFVYVQDDDCVVDAIKIAHCAASLVGTGKILCNMPSDRRPEYVGTGVSLIGWGTVFSKSLIGPSFAAYLKRWPQDELFERECDRLFTYVNRRSVVLIDAGLTHLPHAHRDDRMGREARHRVDRDEICRRARDLEDIANRKSEELGVEVV